MKHPHEVPRRLPDFEWIFAKYFMARTLPALYTDITEEVIQEIVHNLLTDTMVKKLNAHVYLNAYREHLWEQLVKRGRGEEAQNVRTLIEDIKRRVRNEQSRILNEEKRDERLAEYRYLVQISLEDLQLPFSRKSLCDHILRAHALLKEYRDDPEHGALYVDDIELFEIVSQELIDFLIATADTHQLSEDERNQLRFIYFTTLTQAAFIVEQQLQAKEDSTQSTTKR